MAQKPFKDITDRDLFAGLIIAAFAAKEPDKPMGVHASRAVEAADHLIAALKPTTGTPEPGCRLFLHSLQLAYTANNMAKLTKSGSLSALAESQPSFSSGTGRFTIGITGRDGTTWHVHLTATEARQFGDYVDEHT
jgi:hypothetical protein